MEKKGHLIHRQGYGSKEMTVVLNSGVASDHTVGIMAASRHQGWWWHTPDLQLANDDLPEAFQDWLAHSLGIGASRLERTPIQEQFTGHTAVLSRVDGEVQFARGFVPNVLGYIWAFFGAGGAGHWQDDLALLRDPTAVSFEVPVTRPQADDFPAWFRESSGVINVYALRRGNAHDSFNCVLGAVTVLINYLTELGGYDAYVEQLQTVGDSSQGHLLRGIMGGFQ
jgi:hypothetical protein